MSLKEERKKRKITTDDISYFTGISKRTIEAWECGQRDIRKASYENIEKIAKFLNTEIEKIVN